MKVKPKFASVCSVEAARVIFPPEKIKKALRTKKLNINYDELSFEPITMDEIQPTILEGESLTAIVSLENKQTEVIEDYCVPADDMRTLVLQGLKILALTGDMVALAALHTMKEVSETIDEMDDDEDEDYEEDDE